MSFFELREGMTHHLRHPFSLDANISSPCIRTQMGLSVCSEWIRDLDLQH